MGSYREILNDLVAFPQIQRFGGTTYVLRSTIQALRIFDPDPFIPCFVIMVIPPEPFCLPPEHH